MKVSGNNVYGEVENIHQPWAITIIQSKPILWSMGGSVVEDDISKPNFDLVNRSRNLSKSFRIYVIIGSVLIMIAVIGSFLILSIVVFLPRNYKKHDMNLVEEENWDWLSITISLACEST